MESPQSATGALLEFEPVEGASNIRISKIFETPAGVRVRAMLLTRDRAILTPARAGDSSLGSIVIEGFPKGTVTKGFWGKAWDAITEAADDLLDSVIDAVDGGDGGGGGGGGQKCTTTTNVSVGPDGKIRNITTTTSCSPA